MAESKRDDRYIQFPLCLLQTTYESPEKGLNLILGFGIVNYAKKFDYSILEVGRQLMYAYYRNHSMIQADLLRTMLRYIENDELTIDEDYNGFGTDGTFDPFANEDCELLTLFEQDEKFKEAAILRYQITQAVDFLNISIGNIDNVIKSYNQGLKIQKSFEYMFGMDSWTSVKPDMVFRFRDSLDDLDLFRAYIGIKSKIGMKDFVTTSKPEILGRMIGCKKTAAFEYYRTNKHLMPTIKKFSKRYHMDKLLDTLVERRFIMYLSKPKVSVIYVSRHMEPEKLGEAIRKTNVKPNLKRRMKVVSESLFNSK